MPHQTSGTTLFLDDDVEDSVMNNRGSQDDIVSQYVHDIDKKEVSFSSRKGSQKGHPSASRQILDLDGDFDEEPSGSQSRLRVSEKFTPSKQHIAPWDTPASPMDEIFRQTVGTLGSSKKLPYIPNTDMNDSSTNVSDDNSNSPTFDDINQEKYSGPADSDNESSSQHLHQDTEFVESYQEAEREIFGIRPASSSSSEVPDASLQPQIDTEESYADEDYISISDLPPDFGVPSDDSKPSHHLYNGVYHNEPPLSEEDLESLEKQMEQLNNSQSSRLFSQPSIAEIIVGEADNLVVLPRGESPVSSPESRLMSRSKKSDLFAEGSPKYTNNIPDSSSDSEEDSENQDSLTPPLVANHSENIQINTLPSEDTDEILSNRQNWVYSGNNPHIPPSPFIDEGFKNQIPYPKSMNGLSPSSSLDFQAISRRRSKEENEENDTDNDSGEDIEPRKLDQSFLVPSPQRHLNYQVSPNERKVNDPESSSEDESDVDCPPQSEAIISPPNVMTSDDEREEDRRLFDAIMSQKPKASKTKGSHPSSTSDFPAPTEEEMQEYFAEMMRNALKGFNNFVMGPNSSSNFQSDDPELKLQEISANAIENMDKRFRDLFSRHLPPTSQLTSSLTEQKIHDMESQVQDFQTKKLTKTSKKKIAELSQSEFELPVQPFLTPEEYLHDSSVSHEYSKKLSEVTRSKADILPVTKNEELNKMFTQSFRELVSYYQPDEGSNHKISSHNKKNVDDAPSSPLPSTSKEKKVRKAQGSLKKNVESELDLGEGQPRSQESNEKSVKLKKQKNPKNDRSLSPNRKKDIIPSSTQEKPRVASLLQENHHDEITPATDYSKHLHGNSLTSGRVVYGIHNEGPIMAQEWNSTNNKPARRGQRSNSPPSSAPTSPIKKNAKPILRSQSPDLSKRKKGVRWNHGDSESDPMLSKRPSSARQARKSSASTSNTTKFQHLTAPTFSSVIRSLNIAGIDYNDVQAITQASKDANYFVSSNHSDLSHPSYADSYYTSGIDIMAALAASNQTHANQKKKKKQK